LNLTEYMPADLIDIATALNRDPMTLGRLALAKEERTTLFCTAMMLEGGAKVMRPSARLCDVLKNVQLRIEANEYAQPYDGLGVILPGTLFDGSKDRIATSTWMPGCPIHIILFDEPRAGHDGVTNTTQLHINSPPGETIEGSLSESVFIEGEERPGAVEFQKVVSVARIVINLCLFAVERGVRILPLDARAEKRRRKSHHDGRMARLAARDAQEVVIQDLDLILRATSPATDGIDVLAGHRQRRHRRRGHWKMQAYGPGRTQRKRLFVNSYMVHADDGPDGEVQSILS